MCAILGCFTAIAVVLGAIAVGIYAVIVWNFGLLLCSIIFFWLFICIGLAIVASLQEE